MTTRFLILAVLLLLLSCARLRSIALKDDAFSSGVAVALDSLRIFPDGSWQFLHSIQAEMRAGRNFLMMGLTVVSSRFQTHRSVIMTLEGFVVFDGEYGHRIIVHRALPPFDSPHFAEGLMDDIRLIFLEPDGPVVASGLLENGFAVRRRQTMDGGAVDIEALPDGIMAMSPPACHLLTVPMPRGPQCAWETPAPKANAARREDEVDVLRARANSLVAEWRCRTDGFGPAGS